MEVTNQKLHTVKRRIFAVGVTSLNNFDILLSENTRKCTQMRQRLIYD